MKTNRLKLRKYNIIVDAPPVIEFTNNTLYNSACMVSFQSCKLHWNRHFWGGSGDNMSPITIKKLGSNPQNYDRQNFISASHRYFKN